MLGVLRAAGEYLREKGVASARLEAELLLAKALGGTRLGLYLQFDRPLSEAELAVFRELVSRRARGTPSAYLTGEKEFWSLTFAVDASVLIPRPETELLVERVAAVAPQGGTVLEFGTGCGAVAVAIARERPDVRIVATDVSGAALRVAGVNVVKLGCEGRVELIEGSWWECVRERGRVWDVVVSNPPYVRFGEELAREVMAEPAVALFAEEGDGLSSYRAIVSGVGSGVLGGGRVVVEAGADSAPGVGVMFEESGLFGEVVVRDDLAGIPRVVEGVVRGEG